MKLNVTMEDVRALERGQGQGVGESRQGDGGTSTCKCPNCETTVSHERGTPCNEINCKKCGSPMVGA